MWEDAGKLWQSCFLHRRSSARKTATVQIVHWHIICSFSTISRSKLTKQFFSRPTHFTRVCVNSFCDTENCNNNDSPFFNRSAIRWNFLSVPVDDKIPFFVQTTVAWRVVPDLITWWSPNESKYTSVATLAWNVFAIKRSSVANKSIFSFAKSIAFDRRCAIWNESLASTLLLRKWRRHLRG